MPYGWRDGSPALLIRNRVDTPASGLKKASTKTVLTLYAPSGEELGSSSFDGDAHMSTPRPERVPRGRRRLR
ncbi:hypothetical protein J3A78_007604 [Streptomyces sp. PvR006]|uniref:hypothetical protein n=1 Tax=Streptomyces sp. PvR006 TaxID=2817860 RepID=UPI001AEA293B|nr:hypothetical protein [Streptomyces sp. PvR006]MBP2587126.1 hypothetical protein [Streptomyces sp. PvR006]